ncbi:DegT/DnrJ/EryC1/StrS family aminotransferase [Bulleidia extructa]|uniref:DegT/DnrJ/EryC1/StrS family aminotransferase n=1 Tax=Bulleidia extructa TaxID=118748 RepID=UPI003BF457E5
MENNQVMKPRKVLFSPPDIIDQEINEVIATLKSGWITTGPRTKLLEQKIADWIKVEKAVCLNSQTACAEMALRVLGIGEGDEVITCAYTYTASASIIDHVGAKIVLVDCQKDSNLMDYDALEAAITEKTKAIIPIDLCGVPCDYDRLFEIVEKKKGLFHANNDLQKAIGRVAICADAAHAFGSVYHGKMIGSIADFSSFSFHAVKNFTTAEGGALTWKDIPGVSNEEIYKNLQLLSLHGQNKDALSKSKLGAWEYDIIGPWYKCNMTDLLAAVGLAQFDRYPELLKERRETNEKYDAAFKPLGIQVVEHYTESYTSTGHLYLIRIPGISDEIRREIIERLGEQGIACNVHYKPLPMMTAYKNMGFDIQDYPNAYDYYHNLITLPNHTLMREEDKEYVIYWVKKIVTDYLK